MKITKIKSDKIIKGDTLFDGYLYLDGDKILDVTEKDMPCDDFYDYTGKYVSAGFIEMHTHGAGGFDFLTGDPCEVANACDYHLAHGTTSILPTISASDFADMKKAVANISEAKKKSLSRANIIGAHLEGPYLSAEQCGAQRPTFITPPVKEDYTSLVEQYGDSIARWTYAPENDRGAEFCRYMTQNGILVSAGHTNAIYDDMKTAEQNGCKLITHLYSCTSTITRERGFRRLGVIESAYLSDDLYVEIIADGRHLPHELIKLILKIKGTDKVALVTDSLEIAGTDIKEGGRSGSQFIVEDGVCKLYDRSAFAGSVALADRLIRVILECGLSLCEAVKMMTRVPAEILGLNKGTLAQGFDADVVVFDEGINVSDAFVMGKKVI